MLYVYDRGPAASTSAVNYRTDSQVTRDEVINAINQTAVLHEKEIIINNTCVLSCLVDLGSSMSIMSNSSPPQFGLDRGS